MKDRPLRAYPFITLVYVTLFSLLSIAVRRSRTIIEKPTGSEVLLIGLATYRLSRLISYDRVTQYLRAPFVERGQGSAQVEGTQEEPKGEGLQLAIGQLLTCTYCSSVWAGTFNTALYMLFPRVGKLFLLSMAGSGLAELLDPLFPFLSYLAGFMNKEEKLEEEKMTHNEILQP